MTACADGGMARRASRKRIARLKTSGMIQLQDRDTTDEAGGKAKPQMAVVAEQSQHRESRKRSTSKAKLEAE